MTTILRKSATWVAVAALGLFGATANAATCPNDGGTWTTYFNLSVDVGSVHCTSWEGKETVVGNLESYIASTYGTTLGVKSDNDPGGFFNYITGTGNSGTSGSFTTDTTVEYLLFKTGTGNNDPSWFLFHITGTTLATVYTWSITGTAPINGLSHISAFVPIPAAAWLMGSGLLALFGIARRRRTVPVAA